MTRLDVICPSAPWENETTDDDTAWDVCYSLSIEYGYAQIRERVNGTIIGEYTEGRLPKRILPSGRLKSS